MTPMASEAGWSDTGWRGVDRRTAPDGPWAGHTCHSWSVENRALHTLELEVEPW